MSTVMAAGYLVGCEEPAFGNLALQTKPWSNPNSNSQMYEVKCPPSLTTLAPLQSPKTGQFAELKRFNRFDKFD
jgi:hypothetical protein